MTIQLAQDAPQTLRLLMLAKSAHVYETEFGHVRGVLAEGPPLG